MSKVKRNAVIITVLLFVCAAVYLNWSYSRQGTDAEAMAQAEDAAAAAASASPSAAADGAEDSASLTYSGDGNTAAETMSDYFDSVRLSRQQARDEATETLKVVTGTDGATQEAVDEAMAKITTMAQWSTQEAELESLIMAKGYSDCVVYISDSGVTVTVPASTEGLTTAEVAQITDIVTGGTDFTAADLKINEIK